MKKVILKKGDLLNIEKVTELASDRDFSPEVIIVEQRESHGFKSMAAILDSSLYQIVKDEIHSELSEFGVNVGHFTAKEIKVESIAKVEDDSDSVLVNGEIVVSDKGSNNLFDTHFTDAEDVKAICRNLNSIELEKMKKLNEATEKAIHYLETVVSKNFM